MTDASTVTGPIQVTVFNTASGGVSKSSTVNAEASITIGRIVRKRVPLILRPHQGRIGRKAARALALSRTF